MPQSTSQYIYVPYKFLFDTNNTLLALEHTNHSNWHISSDTTAQFCLFLNLYFLCFFFHGNDAGFFRLLGVYLFFIFLLQIPSTTLQANNEMK